jgi:PAS domain S-box-containing protein
MLAQNATAALAFGNTEEALDLLRSLRTEPNILSAALYKADSALFIQDISSSEVSRPPDAIKDLTKFSSKEFEILVPVIQGNKSLGWLYIKRSSKDVMEKKIVHLIVVLGVLVLCISLTYLLTRSFAKSISKPIIDLANAARSVSEKHDYSVRAQIYPDGELHVLTTAFNLMLSRIDEQNKLIQKHTQDLEIKVEERTLEIKRQRDFAETVINSSLTLIAVFDTECRFIGFNKRCEIEFGKKREEVLGKRFVEIMPAIVGSPAYQAVMGALNGEMMHFEQYRSPISDEFYENFGIPLFNDKNEVYAAILTAHNITATVTANEKVLQSNEELKKKNADLEQFAYVASHDLQEPLRKIQLFIDRALNGLDSSTELVRSLEKIRLAAQRMTRLIRDVLEYSKLSRVEESFVDTDLNLILEYIKSDFELLIAEKNAIIESDKLPVILGNRLQLHQLFANLINNGLKFNKETPHIQVRVQNITVEDLAKFTLPINKRYVKVDFIDNGIGFDLRYKDKLFTIFQRLNPRDQYEGTGIGLALCKKIVDNHHGHIEVVSAPDKGSIFSIILPSN